MKFFKLLLAINMSFSLFAPSAAMAQSTDDVSVLQERYAPVFFAISGVNGHSITLCDRYTGVQDIDNGIPCMAVSFEDRRALNAATSLFNAPFKLDNIWIYFYYSGPARPYPGVSVNN